MEVQEYPIDKIWADDAFNTRAKAVQPIDVIDLAKSIKQHGLQTPIQLRPANVDGLTAPPGYDYVVVAGHRRLMACKINEMKMIPASLVAGKSSFEYRTLNVIENLTRKNLNMLEEALCIKHFVDGGFGREEIAQELSQSPGWVQIRMMILSFPKEIQEAVGDGFFTTESIRELYSLKDKPEEQLLVARKMKERRMAGEKVTASQVLKKPPKVNVKKVRKPAEIRELMDNYRKTMGQYDFTTQALAWAIGEIDNGTLHAALRNHAADKGITYEMPEMTL